MMYVNAPKFLGWCAKEMFKLDRYQIFFYIYI